MYHCYNCGHSISYNDAIEGDGTCPKCNELIVCEDEIYEEKVIMKKLKAKPFSKPKAKRMPYWLD